MNLKVSDPEVARLANMVVRSGNEIADIADEYAALIDRLNAGGIRSERFDAATAHLGPTVRRAARGLNATVATLVTRTNGYLEDLDAADADFDAEV